MKGDYNMDATRSDVSYVRDDPHMKGDYNRTPRARSSNVCSR